MVHTRGRLHGDVAHHLEHVILDHVADDAGLLVEGSPALHAEALGHRDRDRFDVVAVPDGLEERVREPEIEDVLDGFLPEVMIDAEDSLLGKRRVQRLIQGARRGQIATKWLLDDHARVFHRTRQVQALNHARKGARWDREVVNRLLHVVSREHPRELREGAVVVVVAFHVPRAREPGSRRPPPPAARARPRSPWREPRDRRGPRSVATPTTGPQSSRPRRAERVERRKDLLYARSPDAPKKTRASPRRASAAGRCAGPRSRGGGGILLEHGIGSHSRAKASNPSRLIVTSSEKARGSLPRCWIRPCRHGEFGARARLDERPAAFSSGTT